MVQWRVASHVSSLDVRSMGKEGLEHPLVLHRTGRPLQDLGAPDDAMQRAESHQRLACFHQLVYCCIAIGPLAVHPTRVVTVVVLSN